MDSVSRLQGLHADLVSFAETRLANIDRLWLELEDSIQDFRRLLDREATSAGDREAYNSGQIRAGDQDYAINDEFKHISRTISTSLDVDEVEAAKLLIQTRAEPKSSGDSLVADAVSGFHNRRDLLLQSLRIVLQQSLALDQDVAVGQMFRAVVAKVLGIDGGPPSNGSLFAQKCLHTMEEIEKFQAKVADAFQSKSVLGEPRGPDFYSTLEFQRDSLFKQHEALACILAYLFQGDYTNQEDLRKLKNAINRWNRLDLNLVHYLPAFSAAFRQFAAPGSHLSLDATASLDALITPIPQDPATTVMRPFHAVLSLWWTVEYSGQFRDSTDDDTSAEKRADSVKAALKEDALELMLAICTATGPDVWRHPARQELVALLLSDSTGFTLEGDQTSSYFRVQFMESLENFIEVFISNMPDSIRKLKTEEDDQRLNQLVALQEGLPPADRPGALNKLHLECFLVLISFAFEHRPDAAEQWWEDPDSSLYGFLQWASRRQTVPRVSAFCELLTSISEDRECAEAAHKFLLDDSLPSATRGRRTPSMNYQQMFSELQLYAQRVHERGVNPPILGMRKVIPTDMNEIESPVMLSCYLRLLAHLCRQPSETRRYILETVAPALPQSLLLLSAGSVPSYLRASVFATLSALLTDKTVDTATMMWHTLDEWASSAIESASSTANQSGPVPKPSLINLQNRLASVAVSFDQYDAFVVLLRDLIVASPSTGVGPDLLPFPKNLGSGYRAPGIGPYVDFVCGHILAKRISEVGDELQRSIGTFHCLDFIASGFEEFNEDLVALADRPDATNDMLQETSVPTIYAMRSAFPRLMQWILSADVNKAIVDALNVSQDFVEAAPPDAPLLLSLQRSIDIVNRALDLQPTYFDIVKPMLQSHPGHEVTIARSSVGSIEDSVAAHAEIVLRLCQFAAAGHADLSLRALALLQKLSSSAKLNSHFLASDPVQGRTKRLIDMLGPNASTELSPIADRLFTRLEFDIRELEGGFESVPYLLKDAILAFFNACLETQPDLPNIAHLLLGFARLGEHLAISTPMDSGDSVFNALVALVQNYPDHLNGNISSWLIHIKAATFRLLRHLWFSPLSRGITLGQLRRLRFLGSQCLTQPVVSQQTLWDGVPLLHPGFWYSTSGEAIAEFMNFRSYWYNYTTMELRSAHDENLSTTVQGCLATLQGKTIDVDGKVITHPDCFAFFDFLDLDLSASFAMDLQFHLNIDFDAYMTDPSGHIPRLYDLRSIRSRLYSNRADTMKAQMDSLLNKPDEDGLLAEADNILATLEARNRWLIAQRARSDTLHEYVDMIIAVVECCSMDAPTKSQFILQMLQIMLPKLDALLVDESQDVLELARAADALMYSLSKTAPTNSQMDNLITEKLFQLFRASIEGISASTSSDSLRSAFYCICAQYLTRITTSDESQVHKKALRNSMDCVRSAGQRLVQIMCDDAEDGTDGGRLNALKLLAVLASLARTEKSNLIIHSLVKANALELLIEPLKHIGFEFQSAEPSHRPYLLKAFESRMLLLLQISRSRDGAGALLDAGFMAAARDSLLFRADPDLGLGLSSGSSEEDFNTNGASETMASALHTYFVLLSSTLRVLISTFLSRGAQNEQIQYLARSFLLDYRPNIVSVFKKDTGLYGKSDDRMRPLVRECVKCYTGLMMLCGFVDFEDAAGLDPNQSVGFS